jgi:AAA+ superfamily predicted ATPase
MHEIYIFLFLLLSSVTTIFPETAETNPKPNSSDKSQISDFQKYLDDNIKKALGSTISFDEELFEHLYDQAPQEIKNCVELIQKAYDKKIDFRSSIDVLPKRILLVGPPGTGKSTLAKVITYKLQRESYFIKMSLLGNEYKNSEIAALSKIIYGALSFKKPLVIILDEINVITERRHQGPESSDQSIASALWLLLDTCAKNPDILIIATANDISKLPEPLKDRFEGNVFEIYSNNAQQRFQVLFYHLYKDMHICNLSNYGYLSILTRKTDQFSPRQLEMLVKIARQQQFLLTGSIDGVTEEQLEYAYNKILKGSDLLQSKSHFSFRKWAVENTPILQAVSTSVNLGLILFSIGYFIINGKTPRAA